MAVMPIVEPPRHLGLPRVTMALVALAVGLWEAMAELSRLAGDLTDTAGRSWTFDALMGPGRIFDPKPTGWQSEVLNPQLHTLQSLLITYVVLDAVFILVYAVGVQHVMAGRYEPVVNAVAALAVIDLIEDCGAVITLGSADGHGGVSTAGVLVSWVTGIASMAKWAATLLVVALVLRGLFREVGEPWRAALGRQRHAFYTQRFSVLAIGLVVLLSLIPRANLLDQLPDAQRQWLDDGTAGLRYVAWSTLALAVLAVTMFVLGRWRTAQASATLPGAPAPAVPGTGPHLFWLVGPSLLVIGGLLVQHFGGQLLVWRLVAFCVVPVLVVLGSMLVQAFGWAQKPLSRKRSLVQVQTIGRVGDGIAVMAISLASVALVRSFTAPFALIFTSQPHGQRVLIWVIFLSGFVGAVLPWVFEDPVRRWIKNKAEGGNLPEMMGGVPVPVSDATSTGARALLLVGSLAAFAALCCAPVWAAETFGFLACAVASLACFVMVVGVLVVFTRDRPPPQIFRTPVMNLHSAPVLSLLVIAVVADSFVGGNINIHGVRGVTADSTTITAPHRPSLESAFAAWLHSSKACSRTVSLSAGSKQLKVRPMVLVAAEGGGIRATYWTAAALDQLAAIGNGCGAGTAFFSAGASGGAVGLVVGRYTRDPLSQVKEMAKPAALGAAAIGLFDRDVLFGSTGVQPPLLGGYPNGRADLPSGTDWLDRAGLMEAVWQSESKALNEPYLVPSKFDANGAETNPDVTADQAVTAGVTGQLILSSTLVGPGCRALVSQVALRSIDSSLKVVGDDPKCDTAAGPAPHSIDLFSTYGPDLASDVQQDGKRDRDKNCLQNVVAATAAMLASRFPYVTPSGFVGPCHGRSRQQIADGGYTENSGLGTIVDLAPVWQARVRAENELALASAVSGASDGPPFVYPVVLYLDNGYGNDLAPTTHRFTSELLVPPTAKMHSGDAQKQPAALLRRASDVVDTRWLCDSNDGQPATDAQHACLQATASLGGRRVVVVHPATTPAVTAPLGWVLSQFSERSMDAAIATQASTSCLGNDSDSVCANGYGSLKDLQTLLAP